MPGGEDILGSGQQFYDTDLLMFLVKSEIPNTVTCVFGKGRELENPKQAFDLRKLVGFPALANATKKDVANDNGREVWQKRKDYE